MSEIASDRVDLPKDIWIVKPDETERETHVSQTERIETKQSALRAVMDGVAPGIIYDSTLLPEFLSNTNGNQESLVTNYSLTTYRDNNDNPIYEIVLCKLNYAGHLLSERSIGYIAKKDGEYEQTTDSQVIN